ncbi:MAG: AAA family ATPase, partial [Thermoguttaceae bacterium]
MKITSIDIERFGLWSDLHLQKLDDGLNVFYGPNEAGKTTLMDFVRSILYGLQEERTRYVLPLPNEAKKSSDETRKRSKESRLLAGGSLSVSAPDGQFQIKRVFDPRNLILGSDETLSITSEDSLQRDAAAMRVILAGIDEPTFNNVFTFGLDELLKLATLGDTEAADMLFRLSIGLDRVSLVDVLRALSSSRTSIIDPSGKHTGLLEQLYLQREKLTAELGQSRLQVWEYTRLLTEQRKLDRLIAQINDELTSFRRELRINEIARHTLPIWDRRDSVREKIAELGNVLPVPEEVVIELDEIDNAFKKKRGSLNALKEKHAEFRKKIAEISVNSTLWKLAPRIEIILEEETRIIELDQQITQLENEATKLEQDLREHELLLKSGKRKGGTKDSGHLTAGLSGHSGAGSAAQGNTASTHAASVNASTSAAQISGNAVLGGESESTLRSASTLREIQKTAAPEPTRNLHEYRVYSKQVKRTRRRLIRTKQQYDELTERVKVLSETMRNEMAKRDTTDLHDAIERANDMVLNLRKRQGIAQRLEEMGQYRKELDRHNVHLIQNQVVPPWMLVILGGIGITTCVLLVLHFLNGSVPLPFGAAGALVVVAGWVTKIMLERQNAQKLEQNQRQLSLLTTQIDQTKNDAAAIDSRFPASGMSIELRLQNAQKELAALEKLIPIDAQRKEAVHNIKIEEERFASAKAAAQSAEKKWTDWLVSAQLPIDWTPQQIRDLIGKFDNVGELRRNLSRIYDEIDARVRDLRTITDRIDRIVLETNMTFPDGLSYVDVLTQIRKRLAASEESNKRRNAVRDEMKKLKPQRRKIVAEIRQIRTSRTELLAKYGARNSEELLKLAEMY